MGRRMDLGTGVDWQSGPVGRGRQRGVCSYRPHGEPQSMPVEYAWVHIWCSSAGSVRVDLGTNTHVTAANPQILAHDSNGYEQLFPPWADEEDAYCIFACMNAPHMSVQVYAEQTQLSFVFCI